MENTEKKKLVVWMIGIGFFFWILLFMFVLGHGIKQAKAGSFKTSNNVDTGFTYDENQGIKNNTYNISTPQGYIYTSPVDNTKYNLFLMGYGSDFTPVSNYQVIGYNCSYTANTTGGTLACASGTVGYNGTGLGVSYRNFNIVYNSNNTRYELTWNGRFDGGVTNVFLPIASSGGGYTQADLDQAYADGQLDVLNKLSDKCYSVGSATICAKGLDYNSYSDAALNLEGATLTSHAYGLGELDALNTAAASTYGSGTTYSSYNSSDIEYEEQYAYAKGIADTTNELAETSTGDTSVYGYPYTASFILDPTIWSDKFAFAKYQQSHAYGVGRLEVLNYISVHYPGGTKTVYSSYTQNDLNTEISGIQQTAYNLGANNAANYTRGKIDVLNAFSHTLHGTQTDYTDFNSNYVIDEATNIYNAGINYGASASGSSQSLTRFIPNVFGAVAGSLWPVMTYQVFGVSLLSIFLVLLGIALAYIIIKMLL